MPSCHDNHLRLLVASQCYLLPLQFFRRFIWVPVWNRAIRARGEAPRQWPGCRPGSHSGGTLCGQLCRGNVTNHWFLAFSFFSPANYRSDILPCKESLAPKVTLKKSLQMYQYYTRIQTPPIRHRTCWSAGPIQQTSHRCTVLYKLENKVVPSPLTHKSTEKNGSAFSQKNLFISKCVYNKLM